MTLKLISFFVLSIGIILSCNADNGDEFYGFEKSNEHFEDNDFNDNRDIGWDEADEGVMKRRDVSNIDSISSTTTENTFNYENNTNVVTEDTNLSSITTTELEETSSSTSSTSQPLASSSTTETNYDEFENFINEQTSSTTELNNMDNNPQENVNGTENGENIYVVKLSDQIRKVLEKYKESGNVVISNVPMPDPLHIPDMDKRFSMANMNFVNQTVYGLSNFTVQHINTDLEKMQVFVMLHMRRLVILGNYSMRSLFSRASGPFNVTLLNVTTEGAAALHYTPEGHLEALDTDMDMYFRDIKLDFKNLGFMGSFFQGVIGSVGSFIFEGVKPAILSEVNTNARRDINEKIRTMSTTLKANSSISPVDQAVYEGRRYIRDNGYDPYNLNNYTRYFGVFNVSIYQFYINGLSRFYRVGEVSLSMDNGTVEFGIHLATNKLSGYCEWSVATIGSSKPIRHGKNRFNVDHLQIRAIIKQSLDLRQHPKLDDLDFLLGNITLTTPRQDTVDFIVELVVNNLPSLLRHIIVDSLEDPIRERAQKLLNEVDVENLVDQQLPKLDEIGV